MEVIKKKVQKAKEKAANLAGRATGRHDKVEKKLAKGSTEETLSLLDSYYLQENPELLEHMVQQYPEQGITDTIKKGGLGALKKQVPSEVASQGAQHIADQVGAHTPVVGKVASSLVNTATSAAEIARTVKASHDLNKFGARPEEEVRLTSSEAQVEDRDEAHAAVQPFVDAMNLKARQQAVNTGASLLTNVGSAVAETHGLPSQVGSLLSKGVGLGVNAAQNQLNKEQINQITDAARSVIEEGDQTQAVAQGFSAITGDSELGELLSGEARLGSRVVREAAKGKDPTAKLATAARTEKRIQDKLYGGH